MDVSNILSTLAVFGLKALRETCVMPRIANRDVEQDLSGGAQKNGTVTISVPAAIESQDVTPAATPPSTTSVTPTSVSVTLSQWKEAPFFLTDKDLEKVSRGVMPQQASEAIKSLANGIDRYLHETAYKAFYGFSGTPATTPFASDLSAFLDARKKAANQLMPPDNRFCIIDATAEANALGLSSLANASFSSDPNVILNGQIGRKLGALWVMSQNVRTHTAGTGANYQINNGAGYAAGIKTVAADTGTGTILAGDIVTFAGVSGSYAVTAALSGGSFSFYPGLAGSVADDAAITVKATHVANLLMHRDAIAFAMAPLAESNLDKDRAFMQSIVDEETGLALRVELTREHKRWRWSFDALYGAAVPRPEFGVRIFG